MFRADYDYQSFVDCGDWVKPSIYHDCGGARFRTAFNTFRETMLSDLDPQTALRATYQMLQLDPAREKVGPTRGSDYADVCCFGGR